MSREPITVVVSVSGGCINGVFTSLANPVGVRVVVVDYDVDSQDGNVQKISLNGVTDDAAVWEEIVYVGPEMLQQVELALAIRENEQPRLSISRK